MIQAEVRQVQEATLRDLVQEVMVAQLDMMERAGQEGEPLPCILSHMRACLTEHTGIIERTHYGLCCS